MIPLLLLCSLSLSFAQEPGEVRLVGGESRCAGDLEVKFQGEWRPVGGFTSPWTLKTAGVLCRELDCGSAVSLGERVESSKRPVWRIRSECVQSASALRECAISYSSNGILTLTCSDSVRLVGGTSPCSGRLEVKSNHSNQSNPSWSSVCEADFDQQDAQVVCRQLGCGAPSVLQGALYGEGEAPMGTKEFQCGGHESALLDCSSASERNTCSPGTAVSLTCSEPDEVRLVGGESRCAGDLELKHQGEWRAVNAFPSWNVKAAGVLCRDLDCGSAVFAAQRVESSLRPVWWIVSGCVQSAAALRECAYSSASSLFLTFSCSEPDEVKLVGGESRCAGDLEVKHQGEWRPVGGLSSLRTLKTAGVLCRDLDCGSAVFVGERKASSKRSVWRIRPDCVQSGSVLRDCAVSYSSNDILSLTCSDSVRLLGGTSPCSGRLEVNSNQSNPSWSSVCEADFDQQDAQVVCRQLGCGAPSVLQGALYGDWEAPMWTKEFQCGGHESALLDCSSASERNTCSPGTAVGLTCSEPVRLVGGESRCAGDLEVKLHGDWRPVRGALWTLKTAGVACRDLDCGSAVSVGEREESSDRSTWLIRSDCVVSESALRQCALSSSFSHFLTLTCSDSVRLVNGTSLCSGRLEVKSNHSNLSNPSWSSVCEADFDQQDAQVVCRQLGCGAPSVLQGALYGEGEAPMGTKEFQCGGHESALLDCSSASERNTCSPGTAVSLTCSEPDEVRLVGGESRCAGDLEVKHQGEWRPVGGYSSLWTLKAASVLCRDLDCGSAVSVGERVESSVRSLWWIRSDCVESGSALRECAETLAFLRFLTLTCSGKLL
ncbi:hypothetical protein KUCAC02_032334 [Chaenocephalus aceratus]|nr:hypothetical protein KUCAC02_032334 [Chaenocephalus aceratus]